MYARSSGGKCNDIPVMVVVVRVANSRRAMKWRLKLQE